MKTTISFFVLLALATLAGCDGGDQSNPSARIPLKELRLGFFPNVTHAQALVAQADGSFDKAVGVPVRWTAFTAGPTAIEALFAGAIDAAYVGPNPAINGFIKSKGKEFVIVSGAASGGAAPWRSGSGITGPRDFAKKTIATPQLGNTQDVAARLWFKSQGYTTADRGGNLTLQPLANADQLLLFQKGELDGAWTIEPWVSRLEHEANGKVLLEEGTLWPGGRYVTAHLIVRRKVLESDPDLVVKLLEAHVVVTQRIKADLAAAGAIINARIKTLTGKELPPAVIAAALNRVEFTWDPISSSLYKSAQDAFEVGFLREKPDLAGIYDLRLLNQVLAAKGLPGVSDQPGNAGAITRPEHVP